MKRIIIMGVGSVAALILLFVGYLNFENYQLNQSIERDLRQKRAGQLIQVAGDQKTAVYLKAHPKVTVKLSAADNQGYRQFGYYTGLLNQQRVRVNATITQSGWLIQHYQLTKVTLN